MAQWSALPAPYRSQGCIAKDLSALAGRSSRQSRRLLDMGWERMRVELALPPSKRDLRLDLFRGLANWLMFLGHVSTTVLA